MSVKKDRGNRAGRKPLGTSAGFLMGGGLVVAVALVLFVFSRNQRNAPLASEVAAPPAPATSAAPPPSDHEHGAEIAVPRITAVDLRSALDKGEAVVIDVRDIESYKAGHIPGSMHIPLEFIEGEVGYLPGGKMIVTYCT